MSLRVVSLTFKVIKFILIVLLLGLGVHYGFIVPRRNYSLEYAGIFGASARSIVEGTLLLYFLYRVSVIIAKTRFGKQEMMDKKISKCKNKSPEKDNVYYNETLLLILVVFPIAIGTQLAHSTIDLPSSTFFQILRVAMFFVTLRAVSIIYNENVEFSEAE